MNQPVKSCFTFGEFLLDGAERRLMRQGATVPLTPKVFDTLLLLVENPGHLLEKDEMMKQLWPDTFVGEDALVRNISILRKALGESSDSQSYIATVPKRGYRFVAPVQRMTGPFSASQDPITGQVVEPTQTKQGRQERNSHEDQAPVTGDSRAPAEYADLGETWNSGLWCRRIAFIALALATGSLAGLITFYLLVPSPVPRVLRSIQLTHSGRVDAFAWPASDSSRLYYLEREGDHWNLMETSLASGGSQKVAAPFRNTVVADVSPDHTNLLIGTFAYRGAPMPLWIWPVEGGALKRVGEITAYAAAWCPNGRQIVYAENDGLYLVDADGTNVRKLVSIEGRPGKPLWSPDGHTLRFSLTEAAAITIWEVRSDGSQLHRVFPDWNNKSEEQHAGAWTADGKYFVFSSTHAGTRDLWVVRSARTLLRPGEPKPARLTTGPMPYLSVIAGADSHKLFVVGEGNGGNELARYDLKSHQTLSLLTALCREFLVFSPDGAWVACSSTDGSLVRMKPDGSERLVLSSPPLTRHPINEKWSPDGKQVVFDAITASGGQRVVLVSSEGGTPRELFSDTTNQDDAEWSPDAKLIAFSREGNSTTPGSPSFALQILDLSANRLSLLPGSLGMRWPSWSPDGRFIAAATEDLHKVMLFDLRSRQWTQLAETILANGGQLTWAKDGKSLYYQDLLADNEPVYRVRLSDHKTEVVASFESILRGGFQRVVFRGFGPGGSLMLSLDRNTADIYALDVDLP